MSQSCPWNTTKRESFWWGGRYKFNVRTAKRLICDNPREIKMIEVPKPLIRALIGRPPWEGRPPSLETLLIPVDWTKAREADLSVPLIIAQWEDPETGTKMPILIDGYLRLAHAYLDNVARLPAVYLTDKESDEVLVQRPPRYKRRKR
jgi:hypothetical protein